MAKKEAIVNIAYHPLSDTLEIFYELNQPTISDEVERDVFVHYHADEPNRIVGFTLLHFRATADEATPGAGKGPAAAYWRVPVGSAALAALQATK